MGKHKLGELYETSSNEGNDTLASYMCIEDIVYKYKVGEVVFALWNGQLWSAKILAVSFQIHSNGWHPIYYIGYIRNNSHNRRSSIYFNNRRYNEWKSEAMLVPQTQATKKQSADIQRQLIRTFKYNKSNIDKFLANLESENVPDISKLSFGRKLNEWFQLNTQICSILVNDKQNILNGNVLKLPKIPCIDDIIGAYLKTRRKDIKCISDKRRGFEFEKTNNCMNFLLVFFNKTLKAILLYPSEITQLGELENTYLGINYSKLYGIEHLLRLIVKLETYISHIQYENYVMGYISDDTTNDLCNYEKINNASEKVSTKYKDNAVEPFASGNCDISNKRNIRKSYKRNSLSLSKLYFREDLLSNEAKLLDMNILRNVKEDIITTINDFLGYLTKNLSEFFVGNYEKLPTPCI
ncbi:hypothetical protein ACR3K2_29310 [Cryptosporidium serpentis]